MLRLSLVSAGAPCTSTCGKPGIHGDTMAGMQGIGVKTPMAAAVAAITSGLVGAEHMPKEGMLTKGTKSVMFAFGRPDSKTVLTGSTDSGPGAIPKLQVNKAPAVTKEPIRVRNFRS